MIWLDGRLARQNPEKGIVSPMATPNRPSGDWKFAAIAVAAMVASLLAPPPANAGVDAKSGIAIDSEINCLALTIYFEARGEPDRGKLAVGHVVLNRASSPRYPERICAVVRQGGEWPRFRCQFTWWCDGRSDDPGEVLAWKQSQAFARRIFWGLSIDPTAGALWYHAVYVKPVWRKVLGAGEAIGRHIFYPANGGAAVRAAWLEP